MKSHFGHVSNNGRTEPSRAQWRRRLALRRRGDRVAFVFSGGGPLGALQVGALRALFEHGVRPDMTVGTSVGALNASFLAFDPTPEGVETLTRTWMGFTDQDLFPGGRFATWARLFSQGNKIYDNSGLKSMVTTRFGEARIEDAQLPLGIVATDLESGAERVFQSGRLLEPLLASTAMPSVFPPVGIEGRLYTDGGVCNNVPIAPAVAMGARTVYVMDSTSHSHQRRPLVRPMDYLLHAFSLARAQRLEVEREMYSEKVNLIMVPSPQLDFFVPFASMDHTSKLIELGYERVDRFLTERGVTQRVETPSVEAIAPAD